MFATRPRETFLAYAEAEAAPQIGWACSSLDNEGAMPLRPLNAKALKAALQGNLYAETPETVQDFVDRAFHGDPEGPPSVLPFTEHSAVRDGARNIDRALRMEIELRANRYSHGVMGPHATARRMAAFASLYDAFSGQIGRDLQQFSAPPVPSGRLISLTTYRLRKSIRIMKARLDYCGAEPELAWLSKGLSDGITHLYAELNDAEDQIERTG